MQVTHASDEPRLFWLRENPEDPKFSPMPGSRWRRFWHLWSISVLRIDFHLPFTLISADVVALSTTVSATHVYFPACESWIFLMMRFPSSYKKQVPAQSAQTTIFWNEFRSYEHGHRS